MKKKFLILVLGVAAVSCSPNNAEESGRERVVLDFEGEYWNNLVDSPQYGGELLYSELHYSWLDEASGLEHKASNTEYDGAYYPSAWLGVSNYQSTDYASFSTYESQLTVYCSAMHSGQNCLVGNGYRRQWGDSRATITFRGEAAYIESVWVANTCYSYASTVGGLNTLAPALGEGESVWLQATGYTVDREGNDIEGVSLETYLYKSGKSDISGWKRWDLSPLGKVNKVKFDVQWSGEGGAEAFMHPAYFALDDIVVVRE